MVSVFIIEQDILGQSIFNLLALVSLRKTGHPKNSDSLAGARTSCPHRPKGRKSASPRNAQKALYEATSAKKKSTSQELRRSCRSADVPSASAERSKKRLSAKYAKDHRGCLQVSVWQLESWIPDALSAGACPLTASVSLAHCSKVWLRHSQ